MKYNKLLVVLYVITTVFSQIYSDTVSVCPEYKATFSPGSATFFKVVSDSVPYPGQPDEQVYLFKPDTKGSRKFPLVFFCHGIGASDPSSYKDLIYEVVKRGYILVYSPYISLDMDMSDMEMKIELMSEGFEAGVFAAMKNADTTRIAIVGHSMGGGSAPAIAWKLLNENKWGENGACMFIMAPWYSHGITDEMLASFPSHLKLVMQVFQDDKINDHRMAIDIFNHISLPPESKDFFLIRGDKRFGCTIDADHSSPAAKPGETVIKAYGIFRPLCALLDYSLKGVDSLRVYALGNGDSAQTFMGTWPGGLEFKRLVVTDNPEPSFGQHQYLNFWESRINPRYLIKNNKSTKLSMTDKIFYGLKSLTNYIETGKNILLNKIKSTPGHDIITGPVPPITSGYGAPGPFSIRTDTIVNPAWLLKPTYVMLPVKEHETIPSGKFPVVFFAHGYALSDPAVYNMLLEHIVSRGAVVVFTSHRMAVRVPGLPGNYEVIYTGFKEAMKKYGQFIDSTRIGFVGHSFGAGAIPSIAYRTINENGWGKKSAFLFLMAPWYFFDLDKAKLDSYPRHVKMIVQVYENDRTNDPAIAIDLFNKIGIPDSNKNFITVFSDTGDSYTFQADHHLPKSSVDEDGENDAYDYYAVMRLVDALFDYSMNENPAAYKVALGRGSPEQIYMGKWYDGRPVKPLSVKIKPVIDSLDSNRYFFDIDNFFNPLK